MGVCRALTLGMLMILIATGPVLAEPLTSSGAVDAFINLGTGPYAGSGMIASGTPQAWYDSPQVAALFGGTPTAQQQQSFDQAVMQDVQTTFQLSGVAVTLTDNPSVQALHSLSLVSDASSAPFPGAIGTTDLGSNGLSFINPIAAASQSVTQLEWIVAHNISHELMLAFGVPEIYDQTGNYVDARNANFAMMINPNSTFSAAAAQAINQKLAPGGFEPILQSGAQTLVQPAATPTPEPSAVILWGTLTVGAVVVGRRRAGRSTRPA